MRTLAIDEMEQVGGGALPLLAVAKFALPIIAGTAAGTYVIVKGLEFAKELCEQGASAQVKSKIVEMSCTAVKKPEGSASSPTQSFGDPGGMLKARFPDATYG
jgi:hypothetical protein